MQPKNINGPKTPAGIGDVIPIKKMKLLISKSIAID